MKNFILGVGCQKGGTSWMHNYLDKHPQVDMGLKKEYHVFDVLFNSNMSGHYIKIYEAEKKKLERPELILRKKMLSNPEFYFNYFYDLANEKDSIKLVGDITPSYAGLPDYGYEYIKRKLNEKDFNVKVVFIMRDPFDRIWSAVKMRKRLIKKEKKVDEMIQILKMFDQDRIRFRTMYEVTIQNLEKVFNKDDIFYSFYESFFTNENLKNLTSFLEIDHKESKFEQFMRPKNTYEDYDEVIKRIVVNYYRDTYNFVLERFGNEYNLKEMWPSFEYLL